MRATEATLTSLGVTVGTRRAGEGGPSWATSLCDSCTSATSGTSAPIIEVARRGRGEDLHPRQAGGFRRPGLLATVPPHPRRPRLRRGDWSVRARILRALLRLAPLLRSVARLPSEPLYLSDGPAGQRIRAYLPRRLVDARHRVAISTLALPVTFEDYLRG